MNTRYAGSLPIVTTLLASVALSLALPASSTEVPGRLFLSPEHRQTLDHRRRFNTPDKHETSDEPTIVINGVVVRDNGKRTLWLNGLPRNEADDPNGVAVTATRGDPGHVTIHPGNGPATRTGVGDTVKRGTGETTDLLQGGQIRVNPSSPR